MIKTKKTGLTILGYVAIFAASAVLTTAVWAQTSKPAKPSNMKASAAPRNMSVRFHADWCGSCKVMAPAAKKFLAETAASGTLHIKFDLTSEESTHQSAMLASALGLGDLWESNGGKTGVLYIVDAETKQQTAKLNKTNSTEEMVAAAHGK